MIGDSDTDIRTARAAGIPVIAVDFGYSERPVAEFGPDRIISHFAQLPAAIAAIFSAQLMVAVCRMVNAVRLTRR